jgi:2-oxoglutarate ferredoxin oxidoreductase subunit beta
VGVFRAVDRPAYGEAMNRQISTVRERQGAGDLAALLDSGVTWEVE